MTEITDAATGRPVPGPTTQIIVGARRLHHSTAALVNLFAMALADKLAKAEEKYGYSDGWKADDWEDECRAQLWHHAAKGDPRDVAAYAAFCWHHGWSTAFPTSSEPDPGAERVHERSVHDEQLSPTDRRGEVERLRAIIERDRTRVADGLNAITKAIGSREWMRNPTRGSYAWDDERYQREFGEALDEIDAALGDFRVLAADWSDCPTDPLEIASARAALSPKLSESRSQILDDLIGSTADEYDAPKLSEGEG